RVHASASVVAQGHGAAEAHLHGLTAVVDLEADERAVLVEHAPHAVAQAAEVLALAAPRAALVVVARRAVGDAVAPGDDAGELSALVVRALLAVQVTLA